MTAPDDTVTLWRYDGLPGEPHDWNTGPPPTVYPATDNVVFARFSRAGSEAARIVDALRAESVPWSDEAHVETCHDVADWIEQRFGGDA